MLLLRATSCETRAAIGTAETPAEPMRGFILPPERRYMTLPPRSPPAVDIINDTRPSAIIFSVLQSRKFCATIVAPTEVARKMVTMFMSAFCAVSESLSVTPHSRKRLPSMRQPMSGAVEGRSRMTKVATTMGKMIFSFFETSRVCSILTLRICSVVRSFMSGGCIIGMSAMYEYAAIAMGPNSCGARRVAVNIAVGPSAPPMMPIEAASGPEKPMHTARKNAKNTPSCAQKQTLGISQQRTEVGHCANAEEYKRGVDTGLNADIEKVKEPGIAHYVAVAVIIWACFVNELRPQLGMVKGVFALPDKVAEVRQKAAEGDAAQQKRLVFFHDTKVQQHKGDEYHDEIFPATVSREEGSKARLKHELLQRIENVHPQPPL